MITIATLTKETPFSYSGSVESGTTIKFGFNNSAIQVPAEVYNELLNRFEGLTVEAQTTHEIKQKCTENVSIGCWLYVDENGPHLSGQVVTSYICAILVHEKFCEHIPQGRKIMLKF